MKVEIIVPDKLGGIVRYKTLENMVIARTPIPKGFIFDGGTIPRILWPWLPPIDKYLRSTCVHDYSIDELEISWEQSTELFLLAAIEDNIEISTFKMISIISAFGAWGRLRKYSWAQKLLFGKNHR